MTEERLSERPVLVAVANLMAELEEMAKNYETYPPHELPFTQFLGAIDRHRSALLSSLHGWWTARLAEAGWREEEGAGEAQGQRS